MFQGKLSKLRRVFSLKYLGFSQAALKRAFVKGTAVSYLVAKHGLRDTQHLNRATLNVCNGLNLLAHTLEMLLIRLYRKPHSLYTSSHITGPGLINNVFTRISLVTNNLYQGMAHISHTYERNRI